MLAINYVIYLMVHSTASACCQLPSEFTTGTMDDKQYVKLQVINTGLVQSPVSFSVTGEKLLETNNGLFKTTQY